jgi:hypothetical protein
MTTPDVKQETPMAEEVKRYRELIDAPGFSSVYEFSTGRYVLASDYFAAVARAEKAEKEIEALRNLANNLQPGPISEALVGERYTREAALTARVAALEAGLIDAEALLCDEHGGPAANECAARLRALLGAKP